MNEDIVLSVAPLGFPWATVDPFLFCAYHNDFYPPGNDEMGPAASLAGRNIGMDFELRDGWRMYHGDVVPGFPRHPHRGFETITLARHGHIDHSDSLGATARFGQGDVQWMTAGRGVEHSEMFPLLDTDGPNHTELFQIWLNLPRADKMVDPYFTMLWADSTPRRAFVDDAGKRTEVVVVAGALEDIQPPTPPPDSWASKESSDVAVWTLKLEPGARWTVPAAHPESSRVFYFFSGGSLTIGGELVEAEHAIQTRADGPVELVNGDLTSELLMLQGRAIGEPVVQHGPFVVNQRHEVNEAIRDYQRGEFGTWGWEGNGPVHPREQRRFAIHPDGREEQAG